MAAALRSLRRAQQVLLLPRINATSVRTQSGDSTPESCSAPEEPFNNTKYQNLQHFDYTPFTFVDLDVELAKYRLPQPSSGRPSPRH
ncbi:hypothetical protein GDO78_015301 [Eleutherodactylus coqui]|uniref:NADH dehydrogenase [ubiquinone] flavoprotein 3, mitochondrial n=1 Tax=Eleutherodactylus coqui TaxID=57060 RepID=A0A8J6JYQ1_ELECQ|nr:hypothetical protein GDO78_015301 [Eleutherodactylus coqui]